MSAVSYKAEDELDLGSFLNANVTYLMMDLLIKCLQSISESLRLQVFVEENVLKLGDHPIEDRGCDLVKINMKVR